MAAPGTLTIAVMDNRGGHIVTSQSQLDAIARWMAEAQKTYAAIMASFPSEIIWPAMEKLARNAQVVAGWERERRRVTPFIEHGICLAPSMSEELIEECQRCDAAGKGIVKLVLAEYRRNRWQLLRSTVESWGHNRYFQGRMHIIDEALWAHQRGRYTASVALLMPQLEGIVLSWALADDAMQVVREVEVQRKNKRRGDRKNTEGADELAAYTAHLVTAVIGELTASTLTNSEWLCMRSLVRFCARHLYRRYRLFDEHAKLLESDQLLRHAFAHGSTLRVGTAANSLRLFLALDVLSLVR